MEDQQNNNIQHQNNSHDAQGRIPQQGRGDESVDPGAVYAGDSSLQTPEEYEKDKHGDHTKEDNTIIASGIDDLQDNSDGAAGTDRAGTAERKPFGETKLNPGLEDQPESNLA